MDPRHLGGLGISSAQLAGRRGVKQPSVIALEQSEVKGTIELATLRRVAEALGCTVVYSLVLNKPLETMVRGPGARLSACSPQTTPKGSSTNSSAR